MVFASTPAFSELNLGQILRVKINAYKLKRFNNRQASIHPSLAFSFLCLWVTYFKKPEYPDRRGHA